MTKCAWMTGLSAALTLCLAACGGADPSGTGGSSTTGDGGTTTTSDGGSTTTTTTGGGGSTPIEPFQGIRCRVDGALQSWPEVAPDGSDEISTFLEADGSASFVASFNDPPEIRIFIGDGAHVGTYACDMMATHIWYLVPGTAYVTDKGDCTIELTQVPTAPGGRWVGTFSGTLPPFATGKPVVITEGEFDLTL